MTEIAHRSTAIGAFDTNDAGILQYLGLNPNDPRSRAVVAVCRAYDLDPVLKHVIVIPKGGVYITRDGFLHVAHKSGQLDGIVVEQEPAVSEDGTMWEARVTVYRKDMSHGFTFPGRYPVNGSNKQYAPEMALKAAESHALRRAFNVAGLGSADERHVDTEPQQGRVTVEELTRVDEAAAPAPDTSDDELVGEALFDDADATDGEVA